ncbi:MAG TPA: hypothetical protein ENN67_00515, partial [Firmicutes bacterium]|nr:hypothetical protein [Bacillota bacterium]
MTDCGNIAEFLQNPDEIILAKFPRLLSEYDSTEIIELLSILENPEQFRNRLPLRLKLYAIIAEFAPDSALKLLALIRLLRRMGSRKDMPELGEVPPRLPDFADYMAIRAHELFLNSPIADAVSALADSTRAFRSGDLREMSRASNSGINALYEIESWSNPPSDLNIIDFVVSETGHELYFIAINAALRSGDPSGAKVLAESWSNAINRWERVLGVLDRQRYQYYRIVGHINHVVGLLDAGVDAYNHALEHAPTIYTKAFLWMGLARIERELGRYDDCWKHAVDAIRAWQNSPYPQAAAPWIEWLAIDADSMEKRAEIENLRETQAKSGGVEINRVVKAMTELYRLIASLRTSDDPVEIAPHLDRLIVEMEKAGSFPNLVTILATRAVVYGRLEDREKMDESIGRAREIISEKLAPDARPPVEFFVESAHALALR